MGNGRWNPADWQDYTSTTQGKSVKEVFSSTGLHEDFDPKRIDVRESRDSADNPASTPVIVALDVTGSMGRIPHSLVQDGLGVMVQEILDRKPVSDPHIMIGGIGDVFTDRVPFQATQFEADIRIAEQLKQLYLEGGGGGNGSESYTLPWYFGAMKTSTDAFEKRQKKGYLFTVGDDGAPPPLTRAHIERVFGDTMEVDELDNQALLTMVSRMYNVFHIVVEEGSNLRYDGDRIWSSWRNLLGERVLPLSDHNKLAEVVVSTMQVLEGADKAAVAGSWSGDTSLVVSHALNGLAPAQAGGSGGVTRF